MKPFISRTIVFLIAFTFIMGGALQLTNIDSLSLVAAEAKKDKDKKRGKNNGKGKGNKKGHNK